MRIKNVEKFGDMITADHKVLDESQESRQHHKCGVDVQDLTTQWIFYIFLAKPNQIRNRRQVLDNSYVQKKNQDPFFRTGPLKFMSLQRAELES